MIWANITNYCVAFDYTNYSYDYSTNNDDCYDICNQHTEEKCAEKWASPECHHEKFRELDTLKKKFGDKIETCCSDHRYIFNDNCKVK